MKSHVICKQGQIFFFCSICLPLFPFLNLVCWTSNLEKDWWDWPSLPCTWAYVGNIVFAIKLWCYTWVFFLIDFIYFFWPNLGSSPLFLVYWEFLFWILINAFLSIDMICNFSSLALLFGGLQWLIFHCWTSLAFLE